MKPALTALIASACLLLAACTTTDFKPYEDGGRTYLGTGGVKDSFDGVEIWTDGSPARPYKVVGMLYDTRRKAVLTMAGYKGDIAKAIRAHGGDAGIILSQGVEQLGTYTMGSATGTAQITRTGSTARQANYRANYQTNYQSNSIAVRDQHTTIAVIRYVQEP